MTRRKRRVDRKAPIIGLLTVELHSPYSRSLKDKRMLVKSIKDRLRGRFNVAVAETGFQNLWQRSELSVVTVSSERRSLESLLESLARDIEERHPEELVDSWIDLIG